MESSTSSNDTPFIACFQRQGLRGGILSSRYMYSLHRDSVVTALCWTHDGKLWVKYKPHHSCSPRPRPVREEDTHTTLLNSTKRGGNGPKGAADTSTEVLKLFEVDGSQVGAWYESVPEGGALFCVQDTLISPRDWSWFKPSGASGNLGSYSPNRWALCSKSLPPHVVLYDARTQEYTVNLVRVCSLDPPRITLASVSSRGIKLDQEPATFDVSQDRATVCFGDKTSISVYRLNQTAHFNSFHLLGHVQVNGYHAAGAVKDTVFITLRGRERILVLSHCLAGDSSIHKLSVFNQTSGGLQEARQTKTKKQRQSDLLSRSDDRVYFARAADHVVVRDLTRDLLQMKIWAGRQRR